MANKNSPIGVFDSGMGGLTILKEITTLLPHEDIIYFADTASCPYGERSKEDIVNLSRKAVAMLIAKGAKAIVIACNTASTTSSTVLRSEFAVPIIATEPAVKPAVEHTKSGTIGVLATRSTIESGQIERLASLYGKDVTVLTQTGHHLVDLVEGGQKDSPQAKELLEKYIIPMTEAGCDHLVLGCTHYPFLRNTIHTILRERGYEDMKVIDTAEPVAKRVEWVLKENNLQNDTQKEGSITFLSSSPAQSSEQLSAIFHTL